MRKGKRKESMRMEHKETCWDSGRKKKKCAPKETKMSENEAFGSPRLHGEIYGEVIPVLVQLFS